MGRTPSLEVGLDVVLVVLVVVVRLGDVGVVSGYEQVRLVADDRGVDRGVFNGEVGEVCLLIETPASAPIKAFSGV